MTQTNIFLAGILCILSFTAVAKSDDMLQEVKIQAARQTADIKNNTVVFWGPVDVTQGSIHITADKLTAFTNNNAQRILIAIGKPATYQQTMDNGKLATATAKELRYNLANKTLSLTKDATLDQDGSQVTGNYIRYNIEKQKLIAESKGSERVITIIQPETYQQKNQHNSDNPAAPASIESKTELQSQDLLEQPTS